MWRRFTFLVIFLALVASVDAQTVKKPPHPIRQVNSRDPLFDLNTAMAAKTAYWDLRSDKRQVFREFKPTALKIDESKYSLVQIQQVVRHGSSYPNKSDMINIQTLLAKLQSFPNVPSWLKDYKLPYDLSVEDMLSPSGFTDLQDFGMRTRKTLSSAIPMSFSPDMFVLQHTYKSATKYSAMAFASTFFDNPFAVMYDAHSKASDRLLRFYDDCPRYQRDVLNNPTATTELTKFLRSPIMTDDINALRAKLQLSATANITASDVQALYSACAFDLALSDVEDNWCSLMTEQMVKDAEYAEDLEAFYEESHGYKLNYEMSAVLLKDIFQNMKDAATGKSSVVGNFRFVHEETILPLLSLLGYADNTRLRGDWSPRAIDERKFRTSRLAFFMANIEFRLYKKKDSNAYYVQVRVNELPVELPDCDGMVCELRRFETLYRQALGFNFDKACT